MQILEKQWERDYYRELKREKRKAILDAAILEEGMSPENELRAKLLESRYGKKLEKGQSVDYFIRGWMTLQFLANARKSFGFKRKARKELASVKADWQFDLAAEYGETGQKVLYQEFCQLTRVYLDLCQRDRNYGAILFGVGRIKEETLQNKIGRDIYTISYEIPQEIGAVEELKLFTDAAARTLTDVFPEIADDFYELVERNRK
ncbi:MAG: hypothetical protein IJ121_00175 [Eubacterium sp.]|nr:hypothetical protein [Eubacterium sp.]